MPNKELEKAAAAMRKTHPTLYARVMAALDSDSKASGTKNFLTLYRSDTAVRRWFSDRNIDIQRLRGWASRTVIGLKERRRIERQREQRQQARQQAGAQHSQQADAQHSQPEGSLPPGTVDATNILMASARSDVGRRAFAGGTSARVTHPSARALPPDGAPTKKMQDCYNSMPSRMLCRLDSIRQDVMKSTRITQSIYVSAPNQVLHFSDLIPLTVHVWLPHKMFGVHLQCPHCGSSRLEVKEYHFRTIIDVTKNDYLLTADMKCKADGCEISCGMHTPAFLATLPDSVASRFPCYVRPDQKSLAQRYQQLVASDMPRDTLKDLLRYTNSDYLYSHTLIVQLTSLRMSIQSFQESIVESYAFYRERLHLTYNQLCFERGERFPDVSVFPDMEHLGWRWPSITTMASLCKTELRARYELSVLELSQGGPGFTKVTAGDHTFKTASLLRLSDIDDRLFKAVFTLVAGDGLVLGTWFCHTTADSEIEGHLKRVHERFKQYGFQHLVYYSDTCCDKRTLLQSVFRDLYVGEVAQPQPVESIEQLNEQLEASLNVVTVSSVSQTADACSAILQQLSASKHHLVLSTVWEEPDEAAANEYRRFRPRAKLKVLTIATTSAIYSFELDLARRLPPALLTVLNDESIRFIGDSDAAKDLERLSSRFRDVRLAKEISSIQSVANLTGLVREENSSLSRLTASICLLDVSDAALADSHVLKAASVRIVFDQIQQALNFDSRSFCIGDRVIAFDDRGNVVCVGNLTSQDGTTATIAAEDPEQTGAEQLRVSIHQLRCCHLMETVLLKSSRSGGVVAQGTVLSQRLETLRVRITSISNERARGQHASGNKRKLFVSGEFDWPVTWACTSDAFVAAPLQSPETADRSSTDHWRRIGVKLDILHFMRRLFSTLKLRHGAYAMFASRFKDAIFAVDETDIAELRRCIEQDLAAIGNPTGVTADDVLNNNWSRVSRRVRRYIPGPERLAANIRIVVDAFKDVRDFRTNRPLFSAASYRALESMMKHVEKGCVSDPPFLSLYFMVGNKLRCARGTSALEGYHRHLRQALHGNYFSPDHAIATIAEFNHRWNTRVRSVCRGEPWSGHYDLRLRDEVIRLDRSLGVGQFASSNTTDDFTPGPEVFYKGDKSMAVDLVQEARSQRQNVAFDEVDHSPRLYGADEVFPASFEDDQLSGEPSPMETNSDDESGLQATRPQAPTTEPPSVADTTSGMSAAAAPPALPSSTLAPVVQRRHSLVGARTGIQNSTGAMCWAIAFVQALRPAFIPLQGLFGLGDPWTAILTDSDVPTDGQLCHGLQLLGLDPSIEGNPADLLHHLFQHIAAMHPAVLQNFFVQVHKQSSCTTCLSVFETPADLVRIASIETSENPSTYASVAQRLEVTSMVPDYRCTVCSHQGGTTKRWFTPLSQYLIVLIDGLYNLPIFPSPEVRFGDALFKRSSAVFRTGAHFICYRGQNCYNDGSVTAAPQWWRQQLQQVDRRYLPGRPVVVLYRREAAHIAAEPSSSMPEGDDSEVAASSASLEARDPPSQVITSSPRNLRSYIQRQLGDDAPERSRRWPPRVSDMFMVEALKFARGTFQAQAFVDHWNTLVESRYNLTPAAASFRYSRLRLAANEILTCQPLRRVDENLRDTLRNQTAAGQTMELLSPVSQRPPDSVRVQQTPADSDIVPQSRSHGGMARQQGARKQQRVDARCRLCRKCGWYTWLPWHSRDEGCTALRFDVRTRTAQRARSRQNIPTDALVEELGRLLNRCQEPIRGSRDRVKSYTDGLTFHGVSVHLFGRCMQVKSQSSQSR